MDAYDRNNYWAKIVGNIGDNQKLTLSYFGDRADDILYPRYPMDAQVDDTDMFKAKYQLFNLSEIYLMNSKSKRITQKSNMLWEPIFVWVCVTLNTRW